MFFLRFEYFGVFYSRFLLLMLVMLIVLVVLVLLRYLSIVGMRCRLCGFFVFCGS